jgi:glutamate synthase domain-containing protein 2
MSQKQPEVPLPNRYQTQKFLAWLTSIDLLVFVCVFVIYWINPVRYAMIIMDISLGVGVVLAILWKLYYEDVNQEASTIRRNFPIIGRARYMIESVGPEMHQYLVEGLVNGVPFDRLQREVVYKTAKGIGNLESFGTKRNYETQGYWTLLHSHGAVLDPAELDPKLVERVLIGKNRKQPYLSARFNISGMSYGALGKSAILALNQGAKIGGFYHNTGEGCLTPYHLGIEDPFNGKAESEVDDLSICDFWKIYREHEKESLEKGADLVWNVGTGYFGCRDANGHFDEEAFKLKAQLPNVKMIELKLSQGAKPGLGGLLSKEKNTFIVAAWRGLEPKTEVHSPGRHTTFDTPMGLLGMIEKLRALSGDKPVGFKLCIGRKSEFLAICKAMVQSKIYPDFITVDGAEGGTGAAPPSAMDHLGLPLTEGLSFVHQALIGFGIRDEIKIIAAGRVLSPSDMLYRMAMGADLINSARGMMIALGCIQALRCHTGECPAGITTHDPKLQQGLVPKMKKQRVANYGTAMLKEFRSLLGAMAVDRPEKLNPAMIAFYDQGRYVNYFDLFEKIPKGILAKAMSDEKVLDGLSKEWKRTFRDAHADLKFGEMVQYDEADAEIDDRLAEKI